MMSVSRSCGVTPSAARILATVVVFFCASALVSEARTASLIPLRTDSVTISTGTVSRTFLTSPHQPVETSSMKNVLSGAEASWASHQEFSVVVDGIPLSSSEFAITNVVKATSSSLKVNTQHKSKNVTVALTVEADVGTNVIRKWIEVSGTGKLSSYELEHIKIHDVAPTASCSSASGFVGSTNYSIGSPGDGDDLPAGLGIPIYWKGFFFGIEHPAAMNLAPTSTECLAKLNHTIVLGKTPYVSKKFMIGAGFVGHEQSAFWEYIQHSRRNPARLVTLINNWYQFGWAEQVKGGPPMNESGILDELRVFGPTLKKYDINLDYYCLDDNWDGEWVNETGLWGRFAPTRFPHGLDGLSQVSSAGRIGLWSSPFGGYNQPIRKRVKWAKEHGWELEKGNTRLWFGGEKYGKHYTDSMVHWAKSGVGYFKMDGISFHCKGPCVGDDILTVEMDKWISTVDKVRDVRPDAIMAFTTGSTPSAWWLQYVDFLWRGGVDDSATQGDDHKHDRFSTYIDQCLEAFRSTQVPISAFVTFALIQNQALKYSTKDEPHNEFARNLWLMVGRGTLHHDLYIGPHDLTEFQWETLSAVLAYVKAKQDVLVSSRMVFGSVTKDEVYGYAAYRNLEGTLCLRNPSHNSTQSVTFNLGDTLETIGPNSTEFVLQRVFGDSAKIPSTATASQTVTVTLDPLEVLFFEAREKRAAE